MTLYGFGCALLRVLVPLLYQARFVGLQHIPKDRNFILISNHTNALDVVPLVLAARPQPVHFIAKDSLFRNRFVAWLIRKLHAFPVRRGQSDMAAMRQCMQVLRDGHVLGIFPEGHRYQKGTLQQIESGVAVLALKADVPLVPVYITGKYRPFGKLRLVAGAPVDVSDLRARGADGETLGLVKQRVEDALRALAEV